MKITGKTDLHAILFSKALNPTTPDLDLLQKSKSHRPPRRKARSPGYSGTGVRFSAVKRSSRPETPLVHWKFDDGGDKVKEERSSAAPEFGLKSRRKVKEAVSARTLAAVLWRLQLPESGDRGGERCDLGKNDRLGFQFGAGHIGVPDVGHHNGSRAYGSGGKDLMQSPRSVSGLRNGYSCKSEPSFLFSNSAMEGATKWDPVSSKTLAEVQRIYGPSKPLQQEASTKSAVSALKVELKQAQARIDELETERRSSKKKLEHFLKKLSEERATWRSREHEKIRAIIDDIKADLNRERKNRQRLEIVNSKLVNELADAKLLVKRYLQDYEKERKARELIEEVCDELAKEIGEDKAEVEALKRESMKLCEEVEEERKMLQIAEVWREERVQMKLVDAKVMLEEKYSQMNELVAALETFLSSRSAIPDAEEMRKAEFLRQTAASVNIQEIKEFTYEPPNPDDIFSVFEDVNFNEAANEREIEQCVGFSPASHASKNGDIEEDGSGWETASHLEDQGSSYSPEGSDPSVNKICRNSNVSASGTDWEENACEETRITEISEVSAVPKAHLKKVSSISRLWRSYPNNGENLKIISMEGMNGRISNGASISPDRGSANGKLGSPDLAGQWSSPESGNPHINRAMKGCIEWPRGMQKGSLKAKLLEARMESQKIQLRQVLKQKI
ncbi:hypothetical protein ACSBR2_011224 [Camellia fascicularis]